MASTYPLDVVAAARFVQANRGLKGDALAQAIEGKNWDPSVISLTGFPQVLEMMNDKLDWMQQLGDAFLADEATVLRTVQGLRAKAQAAGNLKSTEQQKVVVEDRTIVIEPAQPRYVYVPVYNPVYVYGPWWAPYYPPWYWAPPAMYYPGAVIVGGTIGFGIGWVIGGHHWGWCRPSWGGNHIHININRRPRPELRGGVSGDGKWQHRPEQRKGVAYRDAATRDRYQKIDQNAVAARRDYRDYRGSNSPGAPGALQRPSTMDRPAPSVRRVPRRWIVRPPSVHRVPRPWTARPPSVHRVPRRWTAPAPSVHRVLRRWIALFPSVRRVPRRWIARTEWVRARRRRSTGQVA